MSFSFQTGTATAPGMAVDGAAGRRPRARAAAIAARLPRPELIGVMALAAVLNLWALSRNGWANEYYAAAVRSMSTSWHDFLFASLDRSGVMTVDKPPLALWIQALSVRLFGMHSLSILVPQALMGVASVALLYDLVGRRFGRVGGFAAALALAVTPISVAVSRHNNPDALLVLCSVAAVWCAVRAMERGSTRWLVASGVLVGLGFETKMGVALVVVPAIAAAWMWVVPAGRGLLHALRQLLAGGAAMVLVGGAWPLLVELTPAADRPWISGTANNTVFSLIFEYNGLGRVEGQAGGPGGIGGTMFGGSTGPLRLLNSALGGQSGWLLGFALVSGLAILLSSRLRRADERTGWLIAVGGAFATAAVLFSFASGIFHPYYVSLLAPFAAGLVGAGAAQLIDGSVPVRIFGPAAVAAGVAVELVVHGDYPGELSWLTPVLIGAGVLSIGALIAVPVRRVRIAAVGGVLAALLLAPTVWAFDTLGHATSGTFPAGGPATQSAGGPGGGPGGRAFLGGGAPSAGGPQLFGGQQEAGGAGAGAPALGEGPPSGSGPGAGGGPPSGGGGGGSPFGGASLTRYLTYIDSHGGGTLAVSSQSSAASAILQGANVAGIGGFSGRESDVTVGWLADEVAAGRIRWVLDEASGSSATSVGSLGAGFGGAPGAGFGRGLGGLPGDTRTGSETAMTAVAKACVRAGLGATSTTSSGTLYDCSGRSAELRALATRQ